jgi:hypothetical protein
MRPVSRPAVRRVLAGVLAAGVFAVAWLGLFPPVPEPVELAAAPEVKAPASPPLFEEWPKDKKPDLVIVLTGQMYGYMQKCGCSHPQKGGLERRYNFIESLKARGWEVIGIDLGDLPHMLPYTPTKDQTYAKYVMSMQALKLMGYQATSVGLEELSLPLQEGLARYTLQKGNELPRVHASNISNPEDFPGPDGKKSSLTESDLFTAKSGIKVGIIGVIGEEVKQKQIDRTVMFAPNPAGIIGGVSKKWAEKGMDVNILLYQGPLTWKDPAIGKNVDAHSAAAALPQFHVILCKTPEGSEAPDMPTVVEHKDPKTDTVTGKTMICQVGQKGQNVGVIGVFKQPGGIALFYQRVAMGEEYETPPEKEKGHPMLQLLQDYSDSVKLNDYMSEMAKRKRTHAVQAAAKTAAATYVGDGQCQVCHQAEYGVWLKTKHAGAYNALALLAKHPTGRQFDGECIICHSVGYEYKTGYVNNKLTPNLVNVQCESCHGPASLHVNEELANLKKPKKQQAHAFMESLSPWKVNGQGAMPTLETLEAMAKEKDVTKREAIPPKAEYQTYLKVYDVCAKCHDPDNDPHFELYTYWPKVVHSGLKKK